MIRINIRAIGLLGFLFTFCITNGQDLGEETMRKEMKIVTEDSTMIFEVMISSPTLKLDLNKRYYWYDQSQINSNLGGYHGRLLDGQFKLLKADELILSGTYKHGLKHGQWKEWNSNGKYTNIINWDKGLMDGLYEGYDSNGKQRSSITYRGGRKNGKYRKWDNKGKLIEEGTYKDDLKHGKIVTYKEDGTFEIIRYKDGNPHEKKSLFQQIGNKNKEEKESGEE